MVAPVRLGTVVAGGRGLGYGQMTHEVSGRGAVPVQLVGRGVDDVAGAQIGAVAAAGLDETAALGDVEGLADGVGVPSGAGGRGEPDRADADAGGLLATDDGVQVDVPGEV